MKLIRAIVRPEKEYEVILKLEAEGFPSLTKMHVFGRGKQKGVIVGSVHYDELPKVMIMMVLNDEDVPKVVETIMEAARTGNIGDGRVFVMDVLDAYTIRTGERGL
jgi:nitrogen regulatory protein PII 1